MTMTHKSDVVSGAKRGGAKTLQIYGREHYKVIGKLGGDSVKSRAWFHALSKKKGRR